MAMGDRPTTAPGWELFPQMHALIDAADPRFTLVATVQDAADVMTWLEALTTTSLWNMQRHSTVEALRDEAGLAARARLKGVEMRFILPRRVAEHRSPLASSHFSYLRLAPVAHPLMISDGARVLMGDSSGDAIWTSEDPDVVARAVGFYDRLWASAEPAVPEGQPPPFTPRMVAIGIRLVEGATDREIARDLGVSERTVSSDVREMSRRLGARSRAHAIALISGVYG